MCSHVQPHKLGLLEEALSEFEAEDSNVEQHTKFAAAVQNGIQCYTVIYDGRKTAPTETSLNHFLRGHFFKRTKKNSSYPDVTGSFFSRGLNAKFRLKLKKVGKITRPFRYDLNQIPYDYTVEVTNRFKGLELPEEPWMEIRDIVQETGIKTITKKKKCKKAKWLSEETLQIAVKRREGKGKGAKERYTHLNAEFQRIARKAKKAFLSDHC